MPQRKLGFVLLGVGVLSFVVGTLLLVVGFVSSVAWPVYASAGLSAVAGLAFLAGTVLLLVSAAK